MNEFELRDHLVGDYTSYTRSFIKIADPRITDKVNSTLNAGAFWPDPLLQLNPTFLPGGTIDDLIERGILHPECARIFRIDKTDTDHTGKPLLLHTHQREAILKANEEKKSYVLEENRGHEKRIGVRHEYDLRESGSGMSIDLCVDLKPGHSPFLEASAGCLRCSPVEE